MRVLVTIAIPTFNRADGNLICALQSAISQTYKNIEIIVSDNCSSDHTEQVVKQFKDPRLQYVRHPENIGANANFNFCLSQAKGDYFLLLHDDDLIDDDFVSVCMKAENYVFNDIGIIRTGTRWIDADGNVLREIPNLVGACSTEDFFLAYSAGKTGIYLCSTLFNTRRLKEIGGFHSKYHLFQDMIAVAKLSALYSRNDICTIKASNRKHPDARTFSVKVKYWCEESTILIDTMCELVPDKATELRAEGRNFVWLHNYNLAKRIEVFSERFAAYLVIWKTCGYMYSLKRLMRTSPLYRFASPLYRLMRSVQGKLRAVW
jgi:glycosyltransferase involved in cell wall biosynthesis